MEHRLNLSSTKEPDTALSNYYFSFLFFRSSDDEDEEAVAEKSATIEGEATADVTCD
jgi:hypothetical protein